MTRVALVAGGFIGLLGAVAVYHLLLFAVLGSVELLSYAAYLFALVTFELARPPYVAELGLGSDQTWFFCWSFALLTALGYAFFRSFLALPERQPRLDRAFACAAAFTAGAALIAPWMPPAFQTALQFAALAVLVLGASAIVGALRRGVRVAVYFGIAYAGLFVGALARFTYNVAGAHLGMVGPLFQFGVEIGSGFQALTLALGLADRIASANEERDRAQRATIEEIGSLNIAYARFVPRAFLDLLGADDVRDVRLGDGVEREMTVLFSDVRSFTSIAEKLTPREIFGFINALLTRTGPVVREHGGIVDKYVGDAIMALFPGGADDGLRAAIGLHAAVDALNGERALRGEPPIAVGAGLHCGSLVLGTIGEAERMDGTVIADAVNVASRIEGLTKTFGTRLIVSENLRAALGEAADRYVFRFLGQVFVQGTTRGIGIYEVLDAELAERRASKLAGADAFSGAVEAFVAGAFLDAAERFDAVLARDPLDGPARYLHGRAVDLATSAIAWAGVDVAEK